MKASLVTEQFSADPTPNPMDLLAARICHDLSSTLGAVSNALEMMEIAGAEGEEFDLAKRSAVTCVSRLRFLRFAFGPSAGAARSVERLCEDFEAQCAPLKVEIINTSPGYVMAGEEAKLLALMLLCVKSAMNLSGHITIDASESRLAISCRPAHMDGPLLLVNSNRPPDQARDIHFAMAREGARLLGRGLQAKAVGDGIQLEA